MELIGNGWVLAGALAVLGVLVLAAPVPRVLRALRRTRAAAEALRTAITGRSRRVQAGLAELRGWRAASRTGGSAGGEVTGGEVTGGEVIGGEVTGGEVTGGEVTGGEVAGSDATAVPAGDTGA